MKKATASRIFYLFLALVFAFAIEGLVAGGAVAQVSDKRLVTIITRLNTLHAQGRDDLANRYFQTLTSEEQEAVQSALTVVEIRVDSDEVQPDTLPPARYMVNDTASYAAFTPACYGPFTQGVTGWNRLGFVTWRYYQQISMCTNGSWVTGAWCSAWASDLAWGYHFEGHLTYCSVTRGGIGWNLIRYFSQGKFSVCVIWCDNYLPWISQESVIDGQYGYYVGW